MGTIAITNPTSHPYPVAGVTVRPGETKTLTDRSYADYTSLDIPQLTSEWGLTLSWTPGEGEAELLLPDNAVDAGDVAAVASTTKLSGVMLIRKSFTAGAGGSADDVTVFAANALPFKFRVEWQQVLVTTAVTDATVLARTRAGGSGTLVGSFSGGSAGRKDPTDATPLEVLVTPGTLEGLFLRRSDSGVAGVYLALVRQET